MSFLPIVERELRLAARRRSTFWLRASAALWMILLGTWFFLFMEQRSPQEFSTVLFCLLTGSSVLFCLLAGVRFTADCLSEEKREGTLGLLFLTDLKGYDVVLGKLVASSLAAFYGVLAVVPMLGIPLLLGGLTFAEFGRMALVAVNTLLFSLAVGLWASAVSYTAQKASGLAVCVILLFAALVPAVGAWLQQLGKLPPGDTWFYYPSVGFTYVLAFDSPYKAEAAKFWGSLAFIHAVSWTFLALASWIVPRTWQDRPAGDERLRWRERWRLWTYGDTAERLVIRRSLLGQNPIFWLMARARLRSEMVWTVLGLIAVVWAWCAVKYRREWLNEGTYVLTAFLLTCLVKTWVAAEIGRRLAEDRQSGALELLLVTPLTVRDFVRGQWLALKQQFLGPILSIIACLLVLALATILGSDIEPDRGSWVWLYGSGIVVLVADLAALFWTGQWLSLTVKQPQRLANENLARILVLPWGAMAMVVLVMGLVSVASNYEPGPRTFVILWLVLSLVTDIGFGVWARHKLFREFRLVAAKRFEPTLSWWSRWWRWCMSPKSRSRP